MDVNPANLIAFLLERQALAGTWTPDVGHGGVLFGAELVTAYSSMCIKEPSDGSYRVAEPHAICMAGIGIISEALNEGMPVAM